MDNDRLPYRFGDREITEFTMNYKLMIHIDITTRINNVQK